MKGSSVEPSVKNERIAEKISPIDVTNEDDKKESVCTDSTTASTNGDLVNGVSDTEMVRFSAKISIYNNV